MTWYRNELTVKSLILDCNYLYDARIKPLLANGLSLSIRGNRGVVKPFSKPFGAVIFALRLDGYFGAVVLFFCVSCINHMDLVRLFCVVFNCSLEFKRF